MARIRTIKPDFFQSEDVAELSYRSRLTWIGLWTHVDDEGRCKANPRLIKGALWPLEDDVTAKHVRQDLDELQANGKLVIYPVDGEDYLQILNWLKHQKISRPTPSKLPEMPRDFQNPAHGVLTEDSVSPHGEVTEPENGKTPESRGNTTLTESSLSPHGVLAESSALEVEKEVEVEVEVEGERARGKTGTRLPSNFTVTNHMHAWALQNTPNVNIQIATQKFRSHYRSVAGNAQFKTDWTAAWETWMLGDQDRHNQGAHLTSSERRLNHGRQIAERAKYRNQTPADPFEKRAIQP